MVDLDPSCFRSLAALNARFPGGPPSLIDCDTLEIIGDVRVACGVQVRGAVRIHSRGELLSVPPGALLD